MAKARHGQAKGGLASCAAHMVFDGTYLKVRLDAFRSRVARRSVTHSSLNFLHDGCSHVLADYALKQRQEGAVGGSLDHSPRNVLAAQCLQ